MPKDKNHKRYKKAIRKVTAYEFMRVMNNFIGGERWRVERAVKELGVSAPTFMRWGNEWFKQNGDLSKCWFIDQDSITGYKKGEMPKVEIKTLSVDEQPKVIQQLPKLKKKDNKLHF